MRAGHDPEPRHQPEWDGLPFDERARRQAAWLNARGKDVCPVCLGFRENGVCPGAHDEAATATRPLRSDKHRCEQPAKCWADPDCPVYSSRGASGQPTTTTAPYGSEV